MTSRTSAKRSNTSLGDTPVASSTSNRSEEKTIPFLRRLTDMLMENEEFISFKPGSRQNGQVTLGRIVVHDRVKVESAILPRYFNHSSFASLRRQLNYFSFTRIGKGRQRGATYCNEGVVDLQDILTLTRRSVSNNASAANSSNDVTAATTTKNVRRVSSSPSDVDVTQQQNLEAIAPRPSKRLRTIPSHTDSNHQSTPLGSGTTQRSLLPARVSPVEGLLAVDHHPAPKRISLDLTGVSSFNSSSSSPLSATRSSVTSATTMMPTVDSIIYGVSPGGISVTTPLHGEVQPQPPIINSARQAAALVLAEDNDKDLLDGCRALLCFSRGIPSR